MCIFLLQARKHEDLIMTTPRSMILLTLFVGSFWVQNVEPHGRLIEPPSRSTMWRYVLKVEKSDSKKKNPSHFIANKGSKLLVH